MNVDYLIIHLILIDVSHPSLREPTGRRHDEEDPPGRRVRVPESAWASSGHRKKVVAKLFGNFCSLSAVSAPIFASKKAFISIFYIYKIIWLKI